MNIYECTMHWEYNLCVLYCFNNNNNNNNNNEASEFLTDSRQRLSLITDDIRETSHLFQHVSVLIQRYNAGAFHGSFVKEDDDVSG